MDLPQEIIDEILSYLPSDDRRSLKNYSLVSKSWLRPSRKFLFAHVSLDSVNYRSWLSKIPPTDTGLLRNVRSLAYFLRRNRGCDLPSHVLALREYLPSFSKLRALTLFNVDIESMVIDDLDIFSAFRHTLESLRLIQVSVTWSAFVGFIGCFPRLGTFGIHQTSFRMDDWSIPRISHVLRGRLIVEPSRGVMEVFFDQFPKLRQEYEELVIVGMYEDRLAAAFETSLRFLRIDLTPGSTPDLSRFSQLRQLEIATLNLRGEQTLISSITSVNFQKIIFSSSSSFGWFHWTEDPRWIQFDGTICQLVDKLRFLGSRNTLEVEFRVQSNYLGEEEHHKGFLPRFKEKGRVRAVSTTSGEVREWP